MANIKAISTLVLLTLLISGCAPKFHREINHPTFGKINSDDPRFKLAFQECTHEIYPNGVTVYGEFFPTGAAALDKFGGIVENPAAKKQIFEADENDPNSIFIDVVKRARVECIEDKGFRYGEIKTRPF